MNKRASVAIVAVIWIVGTGLMFLASNRKHRIEREMKQKSEMSTIVADTDTTAPLVVVN